MNDAPQVVNELLDVLAARFGATGEHLWEVLIRQAYVGLVINVIALVASCLLLKFCWSRFWAAMAVIETEVKRYGSTEIDLSIADPFKAGIFGVIGCIALVLILVMGLAGIVSIGDALNPEYFALQQVLDILP